MTQTELIIDEKEPEGDNIMYLSPSKFNCSRFFSPNVFDRATIKNCPTCHITSAGLEGIFVSLKPFAKISITVHQPISVMIIYDCKEIEANLKLAGFEKIKTNEINIKDPTTGIKTQTQLIEAQKPVKRSPEVTEDTKEANTKNNQNKNNWNYMKNKNSSKESKDSRPKYFSKRY